MLALAAGLGAYPLTQRLTPHDSTRQPSSTPTASLGIDAGRSADQRSSRGGERRGCTLDGPLDVTPKLARAFTCPTSHTPAEQSIHTRVRLGTPDACAAIWTHAGGDDDDYRITICTDRISLDMERRSETRTIAFGELDPAADPALWHDVEVLIGPGITVNFDHERTVSKTRTSPHLTPGAVVLGIVAQPTPPASARRTRVQFAKVTIISTL